MIKNERKFKLMLWFHMHQPDYYDPINNIQYLPWVRKHAIKGYYLIQKLLFDCDAQININFSGILLEQLIKYASGEINDYYGVIENKNADSLSSSDLDFMLSRFLFTNSFRSQRYDYLLEKKRHKEKFNLKEMRDAQVLFKLLYFAPIDEEVVELIKKGFNFTEKDKEVLVALEEKIIKELLANYRKLQDTQKIEVTFTPYYHPILPLLINSNSALESKKGTTLPSFTFSYPDDAKMQVKKSIDIYKKVFGGLPKGMWPAEGGISNESIDIAKEAGVQYIGSDELVLKKSTSLSQGVYNVRGLKTFFRDHYLSDKIGFIYNKQNAQEAVYNLFSEAELKKQLIVIIDGENPWEFYPNSGVDFLSILLNSLDSNNSMLGSKSNIDGEISSVEPGSWIDGFLDTWIGDEETNTSWNYLYEAREKLSMLPEAMNEIYKAESSDFFWWYSDFHKKEVNFDFDLLFRDHLIKAYMLGKAKIPEYLFYPIKNNL